jgi:hypothetical protein
MYRCKHRKYRCDPSLVRLWGWREKYCRIFSRHITTRERELFRYCEAGGGNLRGKRSARVAVPVEMTPVAHRREIRSW